MRVRPTAPAAVARIMVVPVIAGAGLATRQQPAGPEGRNRTGHHGAFRDDRQAHTGLRQVSRRTTTDRGADHHLAVGNGFGQAAAATLGLPARGDTSRVDGEQREVMTESCHMDAIGRGRDGNRGHGEGHGQISGWDWGVGTDAAGRMSSSMEQLPQIGQRGNAIGPGQEP